MKVSGTLREPEAGPDTETRTGPPPPPPPVGVGVGGGGVVELVGVGGGPGLETEIGSVAETPLTVTRRVQLEHVVEGVHVIGCAKSEDVPIGVPLKSHCAPGCGEGAVAVLSASERV